jgi:SAM-dependent methyltransferase
MNTSPTDTSEWDQLWRFDSESALRPGDPAHQSLAAFWLDVLADKTDRTWVLDIACGNGVIAKYIDQTIAKHGLSYEYIGVDSAQVKPPAAGALSHLRPKFFVNQKVEDSSFKNDKFDLIVSQFGFEYCDQAAVVELAARWLKPAGEMVMLVHSETSAITLESKQILEQMRVLEESGLVPLIYRLLERLEKLPAAEQQTDQENGGASDEEAEFYRERINLTCFDLGTISDQLLESRFLEATIALLLSLLSSKRSHMPAAIRKENLVNISDKLQQQQARLEQQLASALDVQDRQSLQQMLTAQGLSEVAFWPLKSGEEEIGHIVSARRDVDP